MARINLVTLQGVLPNGEPLNTGWYFAQGGETRTPQQWADDLSAAFLTAWGVGSRASWFSEDFHWTGMTVHAYEASTGDLEAVGAAGMSDSGTSSSNAMPGQIAVVSSLRTSTPGPRGRGRMYWGGFTIGGVATGGVVAGSLIADLLDLAEATVMASAAIDATCLPGVYSRRHKTFAFADSLGVGNGWDVQRRRANERHESYTNVTL